jgi:hypothetical protein
MGEETKEKRWADRRMRTKIGTGRLERLTAGGKGETGSALTLQAEQKNSDRDWAAPSVARGENGRKETGSENWSKNRCVQTNTELDGRIEIKTHTGVQQQETWTLTSGLEQEPVKSRSGHVWKKPSCGTTKHWDGKITTENKTKAGIKAERNRF